VKENNLMRELNTLEVECLPADIPNSIEVDVTGLKAVGDTIRVRDIKVASGVTITNDPTRLSLSSPNTPLKKVEEPKVVAPEAAAATAAETPSSEEKTK